MALVAAGCAQHVASGPQAGGSPTAAPSLTSTKAPTATPSSTATATPSPTATASATPTAIPTPTLGPAPEVLASYPIDGDRAVVTGRPLILQFSRPMDRASVAASLTLSPTTSSEITWPADDACAFWPDAPWETGASYTLALGTGACAEDGAALREPFSLAFEAGGPGVPIPVLMYHHIKDLPDDASEGERTWTVSPDALAEQIGWLVENQFHSITPTEADDYLTRGEPLPARPVMLTFDDGYKELHDVVMPLFRETELRPVLFIVPEYLGYGAYLTWDQLAVLVADGCVVGAHGYDHSNLRMATDDDLEHQIVDSQQVLAERLGVTVDAFCYPYGSYDDRSLELLTSSAYRTGYTLNPSIYQQPDAPLLLSRLLIHYETTMDDFADRLR